MKKYEWFKERATRNNAENESHTFTDTGVGEIKIYIRI
jgi:hypothetical protein